MNDLQLWQYLSIGLIFVWTGFVRAGLGFGGAALGLPLLLLIVDSPIVFLPLIGVHLLVFTALTVRTSWGQIDWKFLGWALKIMIIPKLLGVFGLLNLPNEWMTLIVYVVALIYGLSYISGRAFTSHSTWADVILLIVGGYISGTSLIGAPLIVAVFARHVDRTCLRDTLFVLWFILVSVKFSVLVYAGVNFWWPYQLWLFPCAAIGHWLGLKAHDRILHADPRRFKQVIGVGLVCVCAVGLGKQMF